MTPQPCAGVVVQCGRPGFDNVNMDVGGSGLGGANVSSSSASTTGTSTARWMAPETTRKDLLEPRTNLRVGFRYLRHLLDEYGGDTRLALTAYNRGPGTVDKLIRSGRNPENGYADMVLTGRSERHVALMTRKFGRKKS